MRTTRLKLGEMLKEAGLVSDEQIDAALKEQKRRKKPIGDTFVDLGFVTEKDIAETLAIQLEVPFDSMPIFATGEVMWIKKVGEENSKMFEVGVVFKGVSQIDQKRLKMYIENEIKERRKT